MKKSLNAQPNQSLIDGITTLQALANADGPIGNRELARQLGLEPTRVNRLLRTLAYLGIAQQNANRKYMPGPGMHVIAAQSLYASGLLRRALHPLERLMETGYLVALGVLWRDSVAYLFHADPKSSDRRGFIGSQALYPATLSGIGMALLASMETEDVLATYGAMETIPGFPGGADALLEELERIRTLGYAHIYSAPEKGHHTVAVVVGDPVECAIGFSGAISPERAADLAHILHETARRIGLGEVETASLSDLEKRRSLPQPAI